MLALCSEKFQEFSSLRSDLNSDSESEQDNVSMVEGLRMYEQLEALKRKLRIIENPLLRLLFLLCVFRLRGVMYMCVRNVALLLNHKLIRRVT